jgi:hypothetical protein
VPLSSCLEGAQCRCRYLHAWKERSVGSVIFMLGRSAVSVPLSSCLEGAQCQCLYLHAWKERAASTFISRLEMLDPEDPFINTTMRNSDAPSFLHLA